MRNLTPAIDLIKRFEGIADGDPTTVNLDLYLCPASYWTIGWGHVVRDAHGRMLKGHARAADARATFPNGITLADAHSLLIHDVAVVARNVTRPLSPFMEAQLTNNQYCALLSFVFNVGIGAFVKSTLLRRLRAGDFADVPRQFMRWVRAGGKVLAGLKRRREAEAALWNTPQGWDCKDQRRMDYAMTENMLTPEEQHVILHALGLYPRNYKVRRWSSSNWFYTAPDSTDGRVAEGLVQRGLMISSGRLSGSLNFEPHIYRVTCAGAKAAGVLSRVRKEDRR